MEKPTVLINGMISGGSRRKFSTSSYSPTLLRTVGSTDVCAIIAMQPFPDSDEICVRLDVNESRHTRISAPLEWVRPGTLFTRGPDGRLRPLDPSHLKDGVWQLELNTQYFLLPIAEENRDREAVREP